MEIPNPFLPEMTFFALAVHSLREELVELADGWAREHDLFVAVERFFPSYHALALPHGCDVAQALAEHEPIRRICLRRGPFIEGAVNERMHLQRNPECLTVVLEPVTDDGLRATALTSRMGDQEGLRRWVDLVRDAAEAMHRGAWAIEPLHGGREAIHDHCHTPGAHELAAAGVPMLSAAGNGVFEFFDLG